MEDGPPSASKDDQASMFDSHTSNPFACSSIADRVKQSKRGHRNRRVNYKDHPHLSQIAPASFSAVAEGENCNENRSGKKNRR